MEAGTRATGQEEACQSQVGEGSGCVQGVCDGCDQGRCGGKGLLECGKTRGLGWGTQVRRVSPPIWAGQLIGAQPRAPRKGAFFPRRRSEKGVCSHLTDSSPLCPGSGGGGGH